VREASRSADLASAATVIVRAVSSLLDTEARIVRQPQSPAPDARPSVAAPIRRPALEEPSAARTPPPPAAQPMEGAPPASSGMESAGVPRAAAIEADRAIVALGEHNGHVWSLILPGDWNAPRERRFLSMLSAQLTEALATPALRDRALHAEHVVATAFAFSRGLTNIHAASELRQFIVDTITTATRARLGALALTDAAEGVLHVAATHGYPAVLVEHVRLGPGEGILGRVLESRRALLVRDIREVPGLQRRPRYRTASFLVVPLLANNEVLGVVSCADRDDDEPFGEGDLTAARAMAAPAALALQNDRLAAQRRELAHAATVDPLTGLFNRRHFHTRIEEEIERARRHGLELALLMIDVDDFKHANDTLGHVGGDYVLKHVAEIFKRSVRVFDVCTRYGGEEFAILMPGSSMDNALVVAERIRSRVESGSRDEGPLPPYVRITVSLGLAVLGEETSSTDLIARADRALYRAKAEGKNRVRVD
jgi:diguanylate cyclase (GGDEF)-like protein